MPWKRKRERGLPPPARGYERGLSDALERERERERCPARERERERGVEGRERAKREEVLREGVALHRRHRWENTGGRSSVDLHLTGMRIGSNRG